MGNIGGDGIKNKRGEHDKLLSGEVFHRIKNKLNKIIELFQ